MKVCDCHDYNIDYPETWTWGHTDSVILGELSFSICNHIEHDLKTANRILVPGLRKTLNLIAQRAEV